MKKNTFTRIENKYILNQDNLNEFNKLIKIHFIKDEYPKSQITSVYYDTDDYRIIRSSIESDSFKEKVRFRKYFNEDCESDGFIEIKRKLDGVVYKRRQVVSENEKVYINQINQEIEYALKSVDNLKPTCLITYSREAYILKDDPSFRLTLDKDIKSRFEDLYALNNFSGESLLSDDLILMEVKSKYGYPQWFLEYLSTQKLYKTSFSKYGTAYKTLLTQGGKVYDKQFI